MITWMSLDFQLEQIWWIVSLSAALWSSQEGVLSVLWYFKIRTFSHSSRKVLLFYAGSTWMAFLSKRERKWERLLLMLLSLWCSSRWIGKPVYSYGITYSFLIPHLPYSLLLYSHSFASLLCQLSWHRLCEIFKGTAGLSDEFSVWSLWSALLSASLTHSLNVV